VQELRSISGVNGWDAAQKIAQLRRSETQLSFASAADRLPIAAV
jgi:hypothetical protein